MKIILAAKSVFPFHPVGGVQKYVYYFAKALKKKGVEIEIVAPLDNGQPRSETFEGIKFTFLPPAIYKYLEYPIGWFGVHRFNNALAKYLRTIEFDILHSFDMASYRYLQETNRKPVVSQIFTDNYLSNPISITNPLNVLSFFGGRTQNIKKEKIMISPRSGKSMILKYPAQYFFKMRPMQKIFEQSEVVLFEDGSFLKEVVNAFHLDIRRVNVLPVGTDVSLIEENLKHSTLSRADLGLSKEDLVLITVNRLAADKGVDKIILSLPAILKEIPQTKLIIVGSGYLESELNKLIADLGLSSSIRHFKQVPEKDLYQYYALSDIFICAFSYPGSSISTLEAMACGLPVLTTAQPWLVLEGKNGFLLKNNEPVTICEAVLKLYNGHQLKKQAQASRDLVEDFDWSHIAERAWQIYTQLLKVR